MKLPAYLDLGIGTHQKRTLPKPLTEALDFFFSDAPWSGPDRFPITTLDDVHKQITQRIHDMGVEKVFLFGHSAFGLLALDYAWRFPQMIQGVAMIGTPLGSNQHIADANHKIFQTRAEASRQELYAQRCHEMDMDKDLSALSYAEYLKGTYIYREAPKYWHQMDYDCSHLWEGIEPNDSFQRLFEEILPPMNVVPYLAQTKVPVFLAAGLSDYDCCPWEWLEQPDLPSHFHSELFHQSGHWPQYEEPEKFAQALIHWTTKNK